MVAPARAHRLSAHSHADAVPARDGAARARRHPPHRRARRVHRRFGRRDSGRAPRSWATRSRRLPTTRSSSGDLSRFDAIVTGVRAFNTRPRLRALKDRLIEYVQQGGTLLVQYNTTADGPLSATWGPMPFTGLARSRHRGGRADAGAASGALAAARAQRDRRLATSTAGCRSAGSTSPIRGMRATRRRSPPRPRRAGARRRPAVASYGKGVYELLRVRALSPAARGGAGSVAAVRQPGQRARPSRDTVMTAVR